jgi:hypothetical protein
LKPAETVYQAIDALHQLQDIVGAVMTNIKSRVEAEKNKIDSIQKRIDVADGKIKSIRGSTSATVVISPANYPVPQQIDVRVPFVHEYKAPQTKVTKYPLDGAKPVEMSIEDLKGTILDEFGIKVDRKVKTEQPQGLGRLPGQLTTVDSLLLFNTHDNPYKTYNIYDTLLFVGPKTDDKPVLGEGDIGNDPQFEGSVLTDIDREELRYKPVLGNVRDARSALPSHMPGLQNVASNVLLEKQEDFSIIAPTAAPVNIDLPDVSPNPAPASSTPNPTSNTPNPPPPPTAGKPPTPPHTSPSVPPPPHPEIG